VKKTTLLSVPLLPLLLPLVLALAGFGCDPEDDSPKGKCTTLADAYCAKVITCGRFGGSRDSCMSMFSSAVMCEKAVSVSADYGSCLDTMKNASCDVVTLTPPPVCNGVIQRPAAK
jgi:hypothetical protein